MTLVLWDIDLTLVDYSGLGKTWYGVALRQAFGIELVHIPFFAGRTERSLTTELLTSHGVEPTEQAVQTLFGALVAVATADRAELATLGRALPGVRAALTRLGDTPGVVQSLSTGNLRELADLKLEAFDLHHYVDREVGGYGSVSEHRHDLVDSAIRAAAAKYAREFPPSSVVVIGDSPADIASAGHHGALAVGVATGRFTAAQLTEAGADVVFADLSDTEAVLRAFVRDLA